MYVYIFLLSIYMYKNPFALASGNICDVLDISESHVSTRLPAQSI